MTPTKPSLALLREMSDEAVLRALMDSPRLTRAELAVLTGLSKPTVGEAVRRLNTAGLVRDTGERTTGRGGVGTYYALADETGLALAVSIAPQGVAVEAVDAGGGVTGRVIEPVRAVALDGACVRAQCENDPRLGFELMRRFAHLATSRLQSARLRLLDVYGSAHATPH